MKIVVAEAGKFIETLRQYAGTDVAVLQGEFNWVDVCESADPFAAILQSPLQRSPIDHLE